MERIRLNEKKVVTIFFLVSFFMSVSCLDNLYATSEYKMIDKLQKMEKGQERDNSTPLWVRPSVEYRAEDLRDPFQDYFPKEDASKVGKREEARTSEPVLPTLTIQGIIWGGNFPQAIINNKVAKVGDTIEGVKIIKIDKEGITVLYGNKEYNLSSPALQGPKKDEKKP